MDKPATTLTGWVTFHLWPDGSCFISDSAKTKEEVLRNYERADITGVIDLSLIPDNAFHYVNREE